MTHKESILFHLDSLKLEINEEIRAFGVMGSGWGDEERETDVINRIEVIVAARKKRIVDA